MTLRESWNIFLAYAQLAGMAITIVALPISNVLMSIGTIWILSACILQIITDVWNKQSLQPRFQRFIQNKSAVVISCIFLLAAVGLLWTQDLKHGLWDIRMKLPMLVLPIAILASAPITARSIRILKGLFLLSLSFAVIWCLLIYWHINPKPWHNVREISVFISNIRFSILLVIGIVIAFHDSWNQGAMGKIFAFIIALFFGYFLYIIQSITGVAMLGAVIVLRLMALLLTSTHRAFKLSAVACILLIPIVSGAYVMHCYNTYFNTPPMQWEQLPVKTMHGDTYDHNAHYPLIEEGHYPMTYIAWSELYEAWQKLSTLHPDSADAKGNAVKGTLIRYASSKGLHKDLDGLMQLTEEDVKQIEQGVTSVNDAHKNPFRKRIDNILFEYSDYRIGSGASGHSVFQRVEFWKAACGIIKNNWAIGVGTGDTKQAFAQQYDAMQSALDDKHRLRAHNQYLTIWLTYGVFGFLLFCSLFVVAIMQCRKNNFLFAAFILIASLSCITEDTLESQAGVMFFTFFFIFLSLNSGAKDSPLHQLRYVKPAPLADAPKQ
jgi:O-Antigen ligase